MESQTHTLVARDRDSLVAALPIETGRIRSRRLAKAAGVNLIRLSLDQGQIMREHTASAPIVVQVISGHAAMEVAGDRIDLPEGAVIHVDAEVPHSVEALTPTHLLLLLLAAERTGTARTKNPASAASPDHAHEPHAGSSSSAVPIVLTRRGDHSPADTAADQPSATDPSSARDSHAASCTCDESDEQLPELDVRVVPHAIRHATVFGALEAVRPGAGLVLVANHDPLPLLAQIEQRTPGRFDVHYVERGPEAWRLRFTRF